MIVMRAALLFVFLLKQLSLIAVKRKSRTANITSWEQSNVWVGTTQERG